MSGLLTAAAYLETAGYPPVLTAAAVAFGFVFVHPFVDGNGRVHRYLIHNLLARQGFTPPGLIFPVSAAILEHMPTYRQVLEHYSHAVLEFIPWKKTADHNLEVLADTSDYYRPNRQLSLAVALPQPLLAVNRRVRRQYRRSEAPTRSLAKPLTQKPTS